MADNNVLSAFYNQKSFLKVKQALDIGKMELSFVNKENASDMSIDCFLDADYFGAIFIPLITKGALKNAILKARADAQANNKTYAETVYFSPLGGKDYNGKCISRQFTIAPAQKGDVVFTAVEYPATKNSTGAFIKVPGAKPTKTIRVTASFDDLTIMCYRWHWLESDYMKSKYTMEKMKDTYRSSKSDVPDAPVIEEPAQAVSQPSTAPVQEASATQDAPAPVQAQTPAQQEVKTPAKAMVRKFKTASVLTNGNGNSQNLFIKTDSGITIAFLPAEIQKVKASEWQRFEKYASERTGADIRIWCRADEKRDDLVYFTGFAA